MKHLFFNSIDNGERRKYARHCLSLHAVFSWVNQQGVLQRAEGVTRDMSAGGAFVLAEIAPPVGAATQVEVALPSLQGTGRPLRIEVQGRVVRVESDANGGQKNGFAAVNENYVVHEADYTGDRE